MKFNPDKKYIYWGLTAFLVIIACLVVSYIVYNFSNFFKGLGNFTSVLTPIVNGFLIAYLLSPLMDLYEYSLIPYIIRLFKKDSEIKNKKLIRYFSVFLSIITLLLVIYAFFQLLVPQLVSSIKSIVNSFPEYAQEHCRIHNHDQLTEGHFSTAICLSC